MGEIPFKSFLIFACSNLFSFIYLYLLFGFFLVNYNMDILRFIVSITELIAKFESYGKFKNRIKILRFGMV